MKQRRTGGSAAALALLGALAVAGPAVAQDGTRWGPTRWGQGGALDLYQDGAERQRMRDGARAAFERGYRAGREHERRRGAAGGGRGTGFGLVWNDAAQSEAYERLERAARDLRRALVLMRREPFDPRRQEALDQARQALRRAQNAMTWLAPTDDADGRRYERRSGRGIGAEDASGGWAS